MPSKQEDEQESVVGEDVKEAKEKPAKKAKGKQVAFSDKSINRGPAGQKLIRTAMESIHEVHASKGMTLVSEAGFMATRALNGTWNAMLDPARKRVTFETFIARSAEYFRAI